jgi:hypothetical protein
VMRRIGELMLRFAFMDEALGAERTTGFLREYAEQLSEYIASLKEFHTAEADKMRMSARLAFESGIEEYEVRLKWARSSLAVFEKRKRG